MLQGILEIFKCRGIVAEVAINATTIVKCLGIEAVGTCEGIVVNNIKYQAVGGVSDISLVAGLYRKQVVAMAIGCGKSSRRNGVESRHSAVGAFGDESGDARQALIMARMCTRA